MASTDDRWERGDPYERYIGRWSRRLAPQFLSWLDAPPQRRWLDVGCGTGALTSAILDSAHPAAVSGVEPSDGFLATATQRLGARAQLHPGTAAQMPLPDAHRRRHRVGPGAQLHARSGRGAGRDAARHRAGRHRGGLCLGLRGRHAADPALLGRRARARRTGRCARRGQALPAVPARRAGRAVRRRRPATRADRGARDSTRGSKTSTTTGCPFLGGQGPAPAYAMSLDDAARTRLRERLRATLPVQAGGAIALRARAWAVKAQRD